MEQAEAFLAQFEGWNHYLCGNPVQPTATGRPGVGDVLAERVLLMDCDPDPDPDAARRACVSLAAYLFETIGQRPTIVDSGRGCQVWVRVGALGQGARRRLARGLAARCALGGAKWDATHDPSRLMRLPGSVNLKTGRTAQVIQEWSGPEVDSAAITKLALPEVPEEERARVGASFDPPTPEDLALVVGDLKRIWDESVSKGERSKRDFRFVLGLVRQRAAPESVCRLLWGMPGSKAREDGRGQDYFDSTWSSVLRHLAGEEKARALANSLPEAARDDAGAPFLPEALDALLLVRDSDCQAEWQRLRSELKKAGVRIRDLELAITARSKKDDEFVPVELRYVAADAKRVGWFRRSEDRGWIPVDSSEVRSIMRAAGQDPDAEVDDATNHPWTFVNEPFQPEVLDGRRWNKDGARLAHEPREGPHPTWDALMDHVGRGADVAVALDPWCAAGGVKTGGDYLRCWTAALFQRPKSRTAYIFLHGEQEAGKSTLHEALRLLFTRGYVKAGYAIKSKEGFNGEIANAVLCAIEEIDLSDSTRETHERVKEWVTGHTISVRAMYRQAYDLENYTHWIQCAQKRSFMPVLPGDTRITEIFVERAENPVPKEELFDRLYSEAPAFLHTIMKWPLPAPRGRLAVPALSTEGKREQEGNSRTDLEEWLDANDWIGLSDDQLVDAFLSWPGAAAGRWDRRRVLKELPPGHRDARRLFIDVRAILAPGQGMTTSDLKKRLPEIWGNWSVVGIGKLLTKWYLKVPWLDRVTIRGENQWRLRDPGGGKTEGAV